MSLAAFILALVSSQRLGELVLARRNTARLFARGAVEFARSTYPSVVALHAAWLLTLWALGPGQPVNNIWLILFCSLQALRVWVIATLGDRWTTRIIVLPDADLVTGGPYRFTSHPNYVVVCMEIFVLPMVFGLVKTAIVFTILNAIVLAIRIRKENNALTAGSALSASALP